MEPARYFVDEQRRGPYALWHHEHHFAATPEGTEMLDRVTYALPFAGLGNLAHALWVRPQLERIFDFRSRRILEIFPS